MSYFSQANFSTGYSGYYPYRQYEKTALESHKMKLFGIGIVNATPNIVKALLGVISENKELKISQDENSLKMSNVITTLKKMGVREEDIKTESYYITPEYDYVDGRKIFRGYRVNNNLSIIIRDIKETGKIIDASVEAGANVVNGISFTVTDPDKYSREALNLAIQDAIGKAKEIGKTLNIEVNNTPIRIDEEKPSYTPIERTYLGTPKVATPVMSGDLEFRAAVNAIFSYK